MSRVRLFAVLSSAVLVAAGCGVRESDKRAVVEQYATMVYANYSDVYNRVQALDGAIDAFLAGPSESTLEDARAAWLDARGFYGQSEVYRFYGGPIDHDQTGVEGYINSWPLDEAWIDYVEGDPGAGIINHPEDYPEITAELLLSLNAFGGEENVATGFHAIEFLLWGQDLSADGAGKRPHQDFVEGSEGGGLNKDRRATYLVVVSDLLVGHIQALVDAWAPDRTDNYRAEFVADDPDASLQKMLVGMGSLSGAELSGERLYTAYESRAQEDEHSCFSDNTLADIHANAVAIQNVYLGRYGGNDGPGIDTLIAELDPELDAKLQQELQASIDQADSIPAPFDQTLLLPDSDPGRQAIFDTVLALEAQTDSIVEAATALGLQVNIGL